MVYPTTGRMETMDKLSYSLTKEQLAISIKNDLLYLVRICRRSKKLEDKQFYLEFSEIAAMLRCLSDQILEQVSTTKKDAK